MTLVAAVSAIVALLLAVLNFSKTASEWRGEFRQKRVEKRVTAVELQVTAWKELVVAQERRNDLLEQRITAAEARETACEEERDKLLVRVTELAIKVKKLQEGAG